MIKLENTITPSDKQWNMIIAGMRNPKNSWIKSDSKPCDDTDCFNCPIPESQCEEIKKANYVIGPNDHKLMMNLAYGGPVHAKFRRMIMVYVDITAPLYWWKEYDTYKVGTVANSCSTMHKIHDKEFTIEDFSCEHLGYIDDFESLGMQPPIIDKSPMLDNTDIAGPKTILNMTIYMLNVCRDLYLKTKDKKYWWQLIQLLPSSYNQKRTVMLNYEVLHNIYTWRKDHKLDEWRTFCGWIEDLPYSELIIGD